MAPPLKRAQVCDALSRSRLTSYLGVDDSATLERYSKNVRLSAALYPTIQTLEIVARNRLEAALINQFGNKWYDSTAFKSFFTYRSMLKGVVVTNDKTWRSVENAKRDLLFKRRNITSGRIVAEQTFGFWCALLQNRFETGFYVPNVRIIFPHLAVLIPPVPLPARIHISQEMEYIRGLRNRIMHHEPIINRANLIADHQRILNLIEIFSPDARQWLKSSRTDRFTQVAASAYP